MALKIDILFLWVVLL